MQRDRGGRGLCLAASPGSHARPSSWLLALMLVICAVLSMATDQFFTIANVFNLLNTSSINLIFAVGLLVVLIAGGIDISFAVAASVVQYVAALALAENRRRRLADRARLRSGRRHSARRCQCRPNPLFPHHLDRRHHRDVQHLLRPADVLHAWRVDLQSAGMVDDIAWCLFEHQQANGTWAELTLPVLIMALCVVRHLGADPALDHRAPTLRLRRQSRRRAPLRHQYRAQCISSHSAGSG